jgi:glycosyltransferase involved in cell wall biosynthesis
VTAPRVVVNTAIYLHGTSGSATATRELVEALEHLESVDLRQVSPKGRGGRAAVLNAIADARWDLWQASRAVPHTDLLVSPCNIGLRGRARRHLLVVHDVMALDRPDLFDRRFAAYFRLLVPRSVRSADRVLTLSAHAAEAIRRMDPGADVRVVAWGHRGAGTTLAAFPARPVVLMVGATEPVKNHVAGVEAVARLRAESGVDVGLRVVGPAGRAEPAVRAALATADPAGAWTSREVDVPDGCLDAAYGSSWLLLQPSYDEGFGLPLVEAAGHGLPSVHSGRGAMPSVLPEVDAGGVTPEALAAAMTPLLAADRWAVAAATAADRAKAFAPEVFRRTVREHVLDLLPEAS